jgi:hypothetical protein
MTSATGTKLISFTCVAPAHATVRPDRNSETLTVHGSQWAVCPAGLRDGHAWAETSAVDFEDLFRSRIDEKRGGLPPS